MTFIGATISSAKNIARKAANVKDEPVGGKGRMMKTHGKQARCGIGAAAFFGGALRVQVWPMRMDAGQ